MSYSLPFAKIFPKTKRGGAKNGQSPLLIRSEMEISNRGQMPNPELLLKLFGWEYNLYIANYNICL
jgi:hypothetical protein